MGIRVPHSLPPFTPTNKSNCNHHVTLRQTIFDLFIAFNGRPFVFRGCLFRAPSHSENQEREREGGRARPRFIAWPPSTDLVNARQKHPNKEIYKNIRAERALWNTYGDGILVHGTILFQLTLKQFSILAKHQRESCHGHGASWPRPKKA